MALRFVLTDALHCGAVGEEDVDAASSAGASSRAAQSERVARLAGKDSGSGSDANSTAPMAVPAAAAASAAAPEASGTPSNISSRWFDESLSYWDQHELAPSERGEAAPFASPNAARTRAPSTLEVEDGSAAEPAPEPEQPIAASQTQSVSQAGAVEARPSMATAQLAAAVGTPRAAAPPQSPAVPTPEKTSAPKARRTVSSVSAGAVGIGHTASQRSGMGTRRKRQLHVPESLLPHLNQLHKMFPKVSVTVRSLAIATLASGSAWLFSVSTA